LTSFPPVPLPSRVPATEEEVHEHLVGDRSAADSLKAARAGQPSVVLDITEPARPMVIDLVHPLVVPPAIPTRPSEAAALLEDVGLLKASRLQLAIKRTLDILGSSSLLLLLSPVLLATAIAVAIDSPGGIIFAQTRIGRDGRRFKMLKFRSMVADAARERHRFAHENHHSTGPVFKIRDDPRVTHVGRVIRRLSIDELPQLVNVLRGDMSLVGPRPATPDEYETYDERTMQRTLVTPGLTCIWQVSGRSDVDFLRWVDMDLDYIRTWTLRLDLRLLARTVPAVMLGRGAY